MVVMLTSFLLRTKTFSTVPCIEQIIKMCLSNQTKTKQKNTKKKKMCLSVGKFHQLAASLASCRAVISC